ncbi:DUF1819 family protein [Mesonia ostreae]|uniref:DUF1819 family protein n=1 Tax=Mesonia ostreae TaxID=861110 RepID=A0ABU2KFR6_9FLAO|nr:DUF1819 family protein [Mesonia ostreae]MDT0293536.1 DUF1819 family protein [Mesonia ostreae]
MVVEKKYNFSFTAASLRTRELVIVAKHQLENPVEDIEAVLGNGKKTTGKRYLNEMSKWLEVLTDTQKSYLLDKSFKVQNEIAFLAVSKYFEFIRDFIVEVIRNKYLVYDYELTEGDYISFFRRKAEYHPEMDTLTEITQKKVKQVTFKILEQAGLINNIKAKMIQPQIIEPETRKAILNDNIELFKIFLLSDFDIENLKA